MTEYDIGAAFKAIEDELIASMIRNMDRHRAEETAEGIQWSMWQAEQLKSLEKYKRENQKRYGKQFKSINGQIEALLQQARVEGNMQQEMAILNAIKNGFESAKKVSSGASAEFFKLNDRKLEALMEATTHDMEQAETAVLRMADDEYRKAIFNAQVYANTGAGTYEKAVDMATKDMLSRGLTCVMYANGARHTLSDYADMAIRTASKRAYLQGEGEKRQEWGIATVIVNKRGNPCPKCLPFCGKVLIDDVWSGGSKGDGRYPLMSKAIEAGLYHPRCKDSHTTYFPGISTADDTWTKEELEAVDQANKQEAKQQYAARQEEKYGRLAEHSLDEENQKRYAARREEWKKVTDDGKPEFKEVVPDIDAEIRQLENKFSELTEGYSYDDFTKDFGSIEEGFEGSSDNEIKRAKEISEKIELLRSKLNLKENRIRPKQESIEKLKNIGIKLMDVSKNPVSDEIFDKYADFINDFEQRYPGYFNSNGTHLKSISIVDDIKGYKGIAGGIYRDGTKEIEIKSLCIKAKRSPILSKSDDFELHGLAHEYGHYIADTLEKNLKVSEADIVQKTILKYYDGDIFKSCKDLKECLSSYGSTSYSEAFAEAFAEAYTCEKPGKFAKLFKEELEQYLNGTISKSNKYFGNSVAKASGSDIMKVVETIHKSVGAKAKNYDVFDPVTGDIVHLAEGTRITQPKNHIMAGKGRERQIDCEDWLNAKYPEADPDEWTKEKGFGYVTDEYGDERKVELHWYQNPKTGKVEMKIKLHDGRRFIEDD